MDIYAPVKLDKPNKNEHNLRTPILECNKKHNKFMFNAM